MYQNEVGRSEASLPEQLHEWKIEASIGIGSYGVVYRARNAEGKECAIKHIHIPDQFEAADSLRREYDDAQSLKRYYGELVEAFVREIKVLESLKNYPNIVQLYDYAVVEQTDEIAWDIYICMELLTSLSEYRMEHKLYEEDVIKLGIDICNILETIHEMPMLHRDIKPDNILVDQDGNFKLADFGAAKQINKTNAWHSFKGTFAFMAPEVYHGEKYGPRADIYSLALVMYRLVNRNKEPFIDPNSRMVYASDREKALARRMNGEKIPMPATATEGLGSLLLWCMEHKPEDRISSAYEMKKRLLLLQNGTYRSAREANRRKRRQLFKRHWKKACVVLGCAFLGIGTLFTYEVLREKSKIERMEAPEIYLEDMSDEAYLEKVIQYVNEKDQAVWEAFANDDKKTFSELVENGDEDTFAACKDYYEIDSLKEASYTQWETDEYQKKSKPSAHVLYEKDGRYLVEVLRSFWYSKDERAREKYHGHEIKSSIYYEVQETDSGFSCRVIGQEALKGEDNEYVKMLSSYLPDENMTDGAFHYTDGISDFTWLSENLVFPDYFQLNLIASYECNGQIALVLCGKNGLDEDVTVNAITAMSYEYNTLQFHKDHLGWTIPKDSSQMAVVYFEKIEDMSAISDSGWRLDYVDSTGVEE